MIIPLPDNLFRGANWQLVNPVQQNRSEFAPPSRQVVGLPGAAYWTASVEHVPVIGDASIRSYRSFMARLRGPANTFLLPATEARQHVRDFYHLMPNIAPLDSGVGVTISTDRRDVVRTQAGTGWGQAYAYYGGTVAGGARVSFRAADATGDFMVGLNTDTSTTTGYTALDYAWRWGADRLLQIWHSGALQATFADTKSHDIPTIIYDDAKDIIVYLRNSEVMAQFAVASGKTLRADIQLYTAGATVKDVSFGGLPGIAAGATSLTIRGFAGSQDQAVADGMQATAIFQDGGAQLVTITRDAAADGNGDVAVRFEPMLRRKPILFLTGAPWCEMAMDEAALGYSVEPGQQYGYGFSATEVA